MSATETRVSEPLPAVGTYRAAVVNDFGAPLALQDHGDTTRVFDRSSPIGLIGANVAFRRGVFERVGTFSPAVQRVKDGVGSTEDHELLYRTRGRQDQQEKSLKPERQGRNAGGAKH